MVLKSVFLTNPDNGLTAVIRPDRRLRIQSVNRVFALTLTIKN